MTVRQVSRWYPILSCTLPCPSRESAKISFFFQSYSLSSLFLDIVLCPSKFGETFVGAIGRVAKKQHADDGDQWVCPLRSDWFCQMIAIAAKTPVRGGGSVCDVRPTPSDPSRITTAAGRGFSLRIFLRISDRCPQELVKQA